MTTQQTIALTLSQIRHDMPGGWQPTKIAERFDSVEQAKAYIIKNWACHIAKPGGSVEFDEKPTGNYGRRKGDVLLEARLTVAWQGEPMVVEKFYAFGVEATQSTQVPVAAGR